MAGRVWPDDGNALFEDGPALDFSNERCPSRRALDLIADRWTPRVVVALSSGPSRYNALRRSLSGVSQRMLTRSLRRLEDEGLVARRVHDTIPPAVEYRLTEAGHSLVEPLLGIARWGAQNLRSYAAGGAGRQGG